MFTSIEPVQICAFQTCQRRGCKNSARRMPTLKSDVTGCRGLHRERGELQQAMRVSAETARRGGRPVSLLGETLRLMDQTAQDKDAEYG